MKPIETMNEKNINLKRLSTEAIDQMKLYEQ
jgi:hypothetical protein